MLFHPSFTATFQSGELRRQFDLRGEIPPFKPRYNIQPSQYAVILRGKLGNEAKLMKMGSRSFMGARNKHVGRLAICTSRNSLRKTIFQAIG